MREKETKTYFYIKRTKTLKNGEAPIYCRISKGKERAEFSIAKSVLANNWDPFNGNVQYKAPNAKDINLEINKFNDRINDIIDESLSNGENINPKEIRDSLIDNKHRVTILNVFNNHNKEIEKLKGVDFSNGTIQKYKTLYNHLETFINKEYKVDDYPFNKVGNMFIKNFETYLKVECKQSHNTCTKNLQSLNKIIKRAFDNGWISKNPMNTIKLKLKKVDKEYLTIEELNKIIDKKITTERIDKVRDIFVFCCFTGLAYSDVKSLKKEHLRKGIDGRMWINKKRIKTNQEMFVPLLKQASDILSKYEDFIELNKDKTLLPVNTNQRMNVYLKEVADICGIKKSISTHTGRHTFATSVALGSGASLEATSKMLGHSNIDMTRNYARITEELVSDNFGKMVDVFEGS